MRLRWRALFGMALLLAAACQSSGGQFDADDQAAVGDLIQRYVSSTLAADWDTWGSTLSPEIIFSPPNQEPISGHKAVMDWVGAFPPVTEFSAPANEITGVGDLAYARGTYSMTVTPPDGMPSNDRGSYVNIFRRQADGSWLYTHNIWNSDIALPDSTAPM